MENKDGVMSCKTHAHAYDDELFANDFIWLMSNAGGRRLVFRLLERAGVMRTVFDPAAKDVAITMAYAEGRKSIGYRVLDLISRHCPEQYARMMKEQTNGR